MSGQIDDRLVRVGDLVTVQDIAERTDFATKTVYSWCYRYRDFPQPLKRTRFGSIWSWPDVDQWLQANPRPGS